MPKDFDWFEALTEEEKEEYYRWIQKVVDEENAWLQNTVDPRYEEELLAKEVTKKT